MGRDRQKLKKELGDMVTQHNRSSTQTKKVLTKNEWEQIKNKFILTEKQQLLYKGIRKNTLTVCQGPAGTAKAQPLYSKILTPNGWVTMGDLKIGDYVISDDGNPTKVIGVFPQGKKEIYKVIMDDGSSTECCGEHLWLTQTVKDRFHRSKKNGKRYMNPKKGTVKTLLEIKDSIYDGERLNHYIPVTKPVNFKYKEVKIDPYLMGLLLGDGCMSIKNRLMFYSQDEELIEYCEEIAYETNNKISYLKGNKGDNYKSISFIRDNTERNEIIRELNGYNLMTKKSHSKFIPNEYLFNSVNVRISILRGLMDTDGTINKSSCSYTTVSESLKNDFCFLVNSLGGVFSVHETTPKLNGEFKRKAYIIIFKLPSNLNPFNLERKRVKYKKVLEKRKYKPIRRIKSIEYVGEEECQCIMVESDSRLYLTDDFIVTHNTFSACFAAIGLLVDDKIDTIVLTKPIQESGENLGFLPGTVEEKTDPFMQSYFSNFKKIIGLNNFEMLRALGKIIVEPLAYMRGVTYDNSIILLDEAQNCNIHQLMLWVTRLGDNSKAVMMGDVSQYDIKKRDSKFLDFISLISGDYKFNEIESNPRQNYGIQLDDVYNHVFDVEDIVRNKFLIDLVDRYEKYKSENNL